MELFGALPVVGVEADFWLHDCVVDVLEYVLDNPVFGEDDLQAQMTDQRFLMTA
jgi:hypothetical protein